MDQVVSWAVMYIARPSPHPSVQNVLQDIFIIHFRPPHGTELTAGSDRSLNYFYNGYITARYFSPVITDSDCSEGCCVAVMLWRWQV
jgi:hypothetical protein